MSHADIDRPHRFLKPVRSLQFTFYTSLNFLRSLRKKTLRLNRANG